MVLDVCFLECQIPPPPHMKWGDFTKMFLLYPSMKEVCISFHTEHGVGKYNLDK